MVNELPSETSTPGTPGVPGQSPLRQHRGLVILVIAMGVLLVVGLAVVAVTLIYRISSSDSQQNDVSATAGDAYDVSSPLLAARHAPEISIARPAGAELVGASSAGDRLTLHFRIGGEEGSDTIVVVDLASGRVLSRIEITAPNSAAAE